MVAIPALVANEHWVLDRAERVFARWADTSVRAVDDPSAAQQIARIEQAIRTGDARAIGEYGSLQTALQRSIVLKRLGRERSTEPVVNAFSTWRSEADQRNGVLSVDRDVARPNGSRTTTLVVDSHRTAFQCAPCRPDMVLTEGDFHLRGHSGGGRTAPP